ncbi:hypothetical protein ASPWEDRAFT_463859 [Aspergillus wentii DTO 134E9]|uniref:Uncharacterized protein n=1 Tax=Aspergillus wentii DTO 134E9 TaxID=1073089 RepID=A0A1L9RRW5_ASPWE|nr:uncharacterized protein ASPWEDRAFT_463859 [Aspergillus wentii DTO 134E9]OJJ37649.1 hypothetical protein ASPWEDRAFT_463859 [Aspergillus wentii DTO 134E9]
MALSSSSSCWRRNHSPSTSRSSFFLSLHSPIPSLKTSKKKHHPLSLHARYQLSRSYLLLAAHSVISGLSIISTPLDKRSRASLNVCCCFGRFTSGQHETSFSPSMEEHL